MKVKWNSTKEILPPDGKCVLTKIDELGIGTERNLQVLKRKGNLWFMPDGSMYVYYTPTHWK